MIQHGHNDALIFKLNDMNVYWSANWNVFLMLQFKVCYMGFGACKRSLKAKIPKFPPEGVSPVTLTSLCNTHLSIG